MNELEVDALVEKAVLGDNEALADLFSHYKSQLRRMIAFRMDQNLKGRVDPSDVLQEAFLDLVERLPAFKDKGMSFFVWLRLVTHERLLRVHRQHLNTQKRDARREVGFQKGIDVTSISLAAHLLGEFSSVEGKAIRAEKSARLHTILDKMQPDDREIIALRIFEGLSNMEIAEVLGLTKQTTSKRFLSAITKLKTELEDVSGF